MLFNSVAFAIFLPVVFILYWIIPDRFRWIVLLVSSYYFYMSWNPKYLALIVFATLISYGSALIIKKTDNMKLKKFSLAVTLVVSFGILFVFKYFNFFADSLVSLVSDFGLKLDSVTLDLLLPVGISFYTFQTLGYVIDVYRGDVSEERHFGKYAAFIAFFPQLVAGPIERTRNLLPQISRKHVFDYHKATYGLKLMAWGFFKKIVVADTLAVYVDTVYDSLPGYRGFPMILAILLFSFQIYCDFSGYSDIAVGTAKLFDIDLMDNFKSPYFSATVKEFWSRWHISLSTWFRDYLYIPLGGNRCGKIRQKFNLLVTFAVSGLWHGANWTFVLWGLLHGIGQIIENLFTKGKKQKKSGFKGLLSVACVFIFVCVTWIFFRAESIKSVGYIFAHLFDGIANPVSYIYGGLVALNLGKEELIGIFLMLLILVLYDYFNLKVDVISKISNLKLFVRWSIYILFIVLLLCMMPVNSGGEFIYFQF